MGNEFVGLKDIFCVYFSREINNLFFFENLASKTRDFKGNIPS
jgi:hypothetical protein